MIRALLIAILFITSNLNNHAQASDPSNQLGTVNFPTSGSEKAQQHFVRGVAALHSFWYTEAIDSFKKSTNADPNFSMGYWGEAIAYNRPLWEEQDIKSAKAALSKIRNISMLTMREQHYINAAQILYSDNKKSIRDKAYSNAMKKIYHSYPEDIEAACFYSLSLLGVARNLNNKLHLQVESGAIALEIYQKNPDHPCAAHYAIHAFDSPDLARLALPSARRYAKIAPESHHAQHMPAHIFVQLGMWNEARKSNEAGWKTSVNWVKKKDLSKSMRDYHSLQWLHYVYLQQGLTKKADSIFKIQLKDMIDGIKAAEESRPKPNLRAGKYFYRMLAASTIETEQWDKVDQITPPEGWKPKKYSEAGYNFVRGFADAMQGKPQANEYVAKLSAFRNKKFNKNYFARYENVEVWELEIKVAIKLHQKDYVSAIKLAKQATLIEAKLPAPSGPPRILKPTYELLGEVYLKANEPLKAKENFAISLKRHPNRVLSLIGLARSAKLNGNIKEAKEHYDQLILILQHARQEHPARVEAKKFLEQTEN
jgi:tetratricopeptide (TPR) repeat protein